MATVTDELITYLKFRQSGADKARAHARQIDRIAGTSRRAVGATRLFEGSIHDLRRGLVALRPAALATVAALSAVGVVAAGGAAFFARSILNTAGEFEALQTTLIGLEGSAEKAAFQFNKIKDLSASTPFQLADLTEAFIILKNLGVDPWMNDAFQIVGDTAAQFASIGAGPQDVAEAIVGALVGETERIKRFGIKAMQEGEKVSFMWVENGKRVTKYAKKNTDEVLHVLLEALSKWKGSMQRQSLTFRGLMSTLSDHWALFMDRIASAGLFERAKHVVDSLIGLFRKYAADGTLDIWAKKISDTLISILSSTWTFVKNFVAVMSIVFAVFGFLRDVFNLLPGPIRLLIFSFFGLSLALSLISGTLGIAASLFGGFGIILKALLPTMATVRAAVLALAIATNLAAFPLWAIIAIVAGLGLVLWDIFRDDSYIVSFFEGVWDAIKAFPEWIGDKISALAETLKNFFDIIPDWFFNWGVENPNQQQLAGYSGSGQQGLAGALQQNNRVNQNVTQNVTISTNKPVEEIRTKLKQALNLPDYDPSVIRADFSAAGLNR